LRATTERHHRHSSERVPPPHRNREPSATVLAASVQWGSPGPRLGGQHLSWVESRSSTSEFLTGLCSPRPSASRRGRPPSRPTQQVISFPIDPPHRSVCIAIVSTRVRALGRGGETLYFRRRRGRLAAPPCAVAALPPSSAKMRLDSHRPFIGPWTTKIRAR
jgi:hypothetical protein